MSSDINPGTIRSRLEMIKAEMASLEADLRGPISKGVSGLREISFEIAEASDDVERAMEILDENYRSLS